VTDGPPITGRLLGVDYRIEVGHEPLRRHVVDVLADSTGDVEAPTTFSIVLDDPETATVRQDGEVIASGLPDWALSMLFWQLNRVVVERAAGILLHAGSVLDRSGRAVWVVGSSGAGKTTTTLALGRAGWRFQTDDVVSVRPDDRTLGTTKPVGVRVASWQLLGVDPTAGPAPPPPFDGGGTRQVAASALGVDVSARGGRPGRLVFLSTDGDPGTVRPLRRSHALARLIEACFDPSPHGVELLHRLAVLVDGTTAVEWTRGPLDPLLVHLGEP
jgi:hypothetical protein